MISGGGVSEKRRLCGKEQKLLTQGIRTSEVKNWHPFGSRWQHRNKRGSYRETFWLRNASPMTPVPLLQYTIRHTTPAIQIHCICGSRTVASPNPCLTSCYFLPCLGHIFQPRPYQHSLFNPWVSVGLPCAPTLNFALPVFTFFFPQKKLFRA